MCIPGFDCDACGSWALASSGFGGRRIRGYDAYRDRGWHVKARSHLLRLGGRTRPSHGRYGTRKKAFCDRNPIFLALFALLSFELDNTVPKTCNEQKYIMDPVTNFQGSKIGLSQRAYAFGRPLNQPQKGYRTSTTQNTRPAFLVPAAKDIKSQNGSVFFGLPLVGATLDLDDEMVGSGPFLLMGEGDVFWGDLFGGFWGD